MEKSVMTLDLLSVVMRIVHSLNVAMLTSIQRRVKSAMKVSSMMTAVGAQLDAQLPVVVTD